MESLLSTDNKALFSFAAILYAMQHLKVMQNTNDGREFFFFLMYVWRSIFNCYKIFQYATPVFLAFSWYGVRRGGHYSKNFGNHWIGLLQFLYAARALCQTPVQIWFPHWMGYYSSYAVDGHKCVKLKLTQPIWHELVFLWLQTITIHSDSDCQNSQWQVH